MRDKSSSKIVLLLLAAFLLSMLVISCGDLKGTQDANIPPSVKFVTVPLDSSEFDFAPIIYWNGSDEDGFVEYYSFADITDSAAFVDPISFYEKIPDEAWVDTIATEARIFLLSESGERTPHIFYVRCTDNEGATSEEIIYRTFFRTNQAPNIPRIGISGWDDELLLNSVYVTDTLFCTEEVNEVWPGLRFTWRGNDPDDKATYTIPLQFQPILVKSPGDTIFELDWSDETDITITGLETGFYTLFVWARDDGFTLSQAPARIEFNVIRPTFEENILIVVEIAGQELPYPHRDSLTTFYTRLIEDVRGDVDEVELEMDGENVRVMIIDNTTSDAGVIAKSLIHQYKLVIFATDQYKMQGLDDRYLIQRNRLFGEYLQVGGRMWYMGRMIYPFTTWPVISANEYHQRLRNEYFAVDSLYGVTEWSFGAGAYAEFIGTRSGLTGYPDLTFDSLRAVENIIQSVGQNGYAAGSWGLSGAQSIARSDNVVTTQYFISRTDDEVGTVTLEDCEVIDEVEIGAEVLFYPPTPVNCYIQTAHENVFPDSVFRVYNTTLGDTGEVVTINNNVLFISYEYGLPWADDHVLEVDYVYDPISDYHLTPCEIRYERTEIGTNFDVELRYRTAMTTFSYYFLEYDEVKTSWATMLNWFLRPSVGNF